MERHQAQPRRNRRPIIRAGVVGKGFVEVKAGETVQ
jgi:hypothetical protein